MLQLNCQLNIQDGGIERLVIVNSYFWFWTIIGWGFCDIQNNQGQDRGYHPKPKADNCFITHWTKEKKGKLKASLCFFTDGKQHKAW